jgi:hypothetical protein
MIFIDGETPARIAKYRSGMLAEFCFHPPLRGNPRFVLARISHNGILLMTQPLCHEVRPYFSLSVKNSG